MRINRFLANRRGFTLTEVLVTVAIISILGILILSASSSMIERAKAAKSMNNLRQIGQGISVLTADGPPGKGAGPNCYPSYAGRDDSGAPYYWMDLVGAKLGVVEKRGDTYEWLGAPHETVFQSPFREVQFDPAIPRETASYGYNYLHFGDWSSATSRAKDKDGKEIPAVRMASLRRPAEVIIIAESDGDGVYDTHIWPPWKEAGVSGDYREGGHHLFADWHIEWLKKEDVDADYQRYFVID